MTDLVLNPILLSELQKAADSYAETQGLECELELRDNELALLANRGTLLYVAIRILRLASEGKKGSHFTIDKADIAPDSEAALTIGLTADDDG